MEGLPVAIKDEMDIEGQPMTNGSLYLKDNISSETHYAVQRLIDARIIVHARTTTPEFSCSATALEAAQPWLDCAERQPACAV